MPEFDRDVKRLAKKYRHILDDIAGVERLLAKDQRHALKATLVQGFAERRLWKGRAQSRDIKAGRSGAYRVYWLDQSEEVRVLISIYTHHEAPEDEKKNRAEVARRLSVNGY